MGKNKNKNKRKYTAKLPINESETAVQSTSRTSEVETDGKTFTIDNTSFDDTLENVYSLIRQFEEDKDDFISSYNFQAVGQNSMISKSDFVEAINKLIPDIIECDKADMWLSQMSHLKNEGINMSSELNRSRLNSLKGDLNKLFAGQHLVFVESMLSYIDAQSTLGFLMEKISLGKEINLANDEAYDEIKKSIEQGETNAQVTAATAELECGPNELILDLESDAVDCDISADNIQNGDDTTPDIEKKKDGNKGTGCKKKEICSVEKIEMKNTKERISPQKSQKKPKSAEEIRWDLTPLSGLENKSNNEKMEEYSNMVPKANYLEENLDLSKEKETSPGRARKTRQLEVYTIEFLPTIEQNHKPYEGGMPSNKIHFEFHTNGNKFFKVYKKKDTYVRKEKEKLVFDFKNEKVQVSFSDGQIFVSTPNNEIDISVKKPETDDLTNTTH